MIYIIFLIPIMMIIIGYFMYKHPPKKINHIVGYRTSKSMKNKRNWIKANKMCGILWLKIGIVTFVLSVILFILNSLKILNFTDNLLTIITIIQTLIIILPIPFIEKRLGDK